MLFEGAEAPIQEGEKVKNNKVLNKIVVVALTLIILSLIQPVSADAFSPWAAYGDAFKSTNSTHTRLMWNATGNFSWLADGNATTLTRYLVVAAGGSSPSLQGAGAGGYQAGTTLLVNGTIQVSVGNYVLGNKGQNSSFSSILSLGGGSKPADAQAGSGSGGGFTSSLTGGLGTPGQGNNGGDGDEAPFYPSGGGGGFGSVGSSFSGSASGPGGSGISNDITGVSVNYSCGGGGTATTQGATYGAAGCDTAGDGAHDGVSNAGNGTANSGSGSGGYHTGSAGHGGSGIVVIEYLTPSNELIVNFTSNKTSGYPNDYFQFNDTTSDFPLTWNWTFGDGSNSTQQNPIHQYTTVGSYSVSLNVTNSTSYNSTTKLNYITIAPLPAPSNLTISANNTYSTDSPFAVLFSTLSVNPMFLYRNLSFGDGDWYNTTIESANSTTHTYSAIGNYNVTLYETNPSGVSSDIRIDFIVVSNPTLEMYPQNPTISRGTTGLMTLRISNLSHVDGGATNLTFNQTAITIDSITTNSTSSQNFTVASSFNNTAGIASIGVSCIDISSLSPSVDIVDIVWRANITRTNDTTPVSFNSTAFTSFVKSNSSYNSFRYPNITYLVPGTITLTDETWMRVLLFKNAYNLNPISGIQVRISYTGVISGSATTNTGSYDLSSTYGTASVTAAADGYYNVTQDVLFNGNGTDTFLMTPLSGAPGQTTWYVPQQVRIYAVNNMGAPIEGVYITCTPLDFTAPEDWTQILIGIQPSVNISGTTLDGWTGTDGSWVAPMLSSFRYRFNLLNTTAGINHTVTFNPQDTSYRIYVTSSTPTNNTLTQVTQSSLPYYKLNSSGYYNLSMIYQDPQGYTTFLQFNVKDYTHGNTLVYTKNWTDLGTSIIVDNYTAYIPLGQEYNWQYNATKV